MIVLVILWWILKWMVIIAGSIWMLQWPVKLWNWAHRLERDGRSKYYFLHPLRLTQLEDHPRHRFQRWQKSATHRTDIYLVVPPNWQYVRLVGVYGLWASRSEVRILDPHRGLLQWRTKIVWYINDCHGRQLGFPVIDGDEQEAIRQLLLTARLFKKWHCRCLAEARLRELEGYAVTGMLNGCLRIDVPEGASPGIRLALQRLSKHLIHRSIALGA